MSLLSHLYHAFIRLSQANGFISSTKRPAKVQRELLKSIIRENQDTIFGKKHGFSSIDSVKDFQQRIPISDYDALAPLIKTHNSLTRDSPIFFSITSGTMSKPKIFPVTQRSIDAYTRCMQIFIYFAQQDHPSIFDGRVLSIISKPAKGPSTGPISSLMYEQEPAFIKKFYAVPDEVFDIEDYDARYYSVMRFAIEKDLRFIATPNPSTLLILFEKASEHKEQIIKDIEQGTISKEFKIEESVREKLTKYLKPNPELGERLKSKPFMPQSYWPNLALVACWKEGTLGHYIPQLKKYIGDTHVRDLGLIASEAYCSIPTTDDMNAGVLTVDTNFYEFMKGDEVFTIEQLKEGEEYSLIVTTRAGLYRYHLDDVVKVIGFYNKTPIVKYLRRGNNITSITGEKLSEWHVVAAMKHAEHETKTQARHFTFYANEKEGRYDIYLEPISNLNEKNFIKAIDKSLQSINFEYKEKRKSSRLKEPKLIILKTHSYRQMHKRRSQVTHDSQIKLPILTDKSSVVKEISRK